MENNITKFILNNEEIDTVIKESYKTISLHKEKIDDRFTIIYGKNYYCHNKGIGADSDKRKSVESHHQLNQQWCTSYDPDVQPAYLPEHRNLGELDHGHKHRQNGRKKKCNHCQWKCDLHTIF